jgi:hypothetical protein
MQQLTPAHNDQVPALADGVRAEIARGWTIFGSPKNDMDPKHQFAPNKVLVLYC